MHRLEDFLDDSVSIPTLPSIAVEILEAVKDEDTSFEALARVVNSDPSLSARVLKVANSSFYGVSQKVNTIPKALSILGLEALKSIALSFVIVETMQGVSRNQFAFEYFWKRAVTAGVAAKSIAKAAKVKYDEAFVSGLLQDIGIIIMYFIEREAYEQVLDEKKASAQPVFVVEKNIFGFEHQEVGERILDQWGLPPEISKPIGYHHCVSKAPEPYRRRARVLYLSDRISAVYHGNQSAHCVETITAMLEKEYNLQRASTEKLIDTIAEKSNEFFTFFNFSTRGVKPYSQLLEEANAELASLNLSYAQLAVQYKREKQKADELARELKDINNKLRSIAYMDALTGLYNRRLFLSTMENELRRAKRYARPFSLILFDIDRFKLINDKYGHRFGDTVLQGIGQVVKQTVRNTDVVARYGGEEFGIVMPETDLADAVITGERLRKQIETWSVPLNGKTVGVTISLGVTDYVAGMDVQDINDLFDIADQALYESKRNGRNMLTSLRMSMAGGPLR